MKLEHDLHLNTNVVFGREEIKRPRIETFTGVMGS